MELIKNDSRHGNDCYIHDHWYFCDDLSLLIHIVKYSCDENLTETTSYKCINVAEAKQIIKKINRFS